MRTHSRLLLSSFALTAAMLFSGCIIGGTPTGTNGDITFIWSLNGRTCTMAQEISQIVVQIPGQTLQNNGVYGCLNGTPGTAGIKLLNFKPGTYSYTITAQNSNGTGVFQATGRVVVNGDVSETVDLKPTTNATGSAYLAWSLPAGTTVTCQYLAAVDITIDGATTPVTSACNAGLYQSNVTTLQGVGVALAPGQHTVLLDARDSNGLYFYRKQASITVIAGEVSQQVFSLEWLVGTVPIRWTFSNGITQLTCAQAGVSTVRVTLRNSAGDLTQDVPCSFNGIDGYIPYAYSGSYTVYTAAIGTAGASYASSATNWPSVTVQAGVFPPLTQSVQPQLLMTL